MAVCFKIKLVKQLACHFEYTDKVLKMSLRNQQKKNQNYLKKSFRFLRFVSSEIHFCYQTEQMEFSLVAENVLFVHIKYTYVCEYFQCAHKTKHILSYYMTLNYIDFKYERPPRVCFSLLHFSVLTLSASLCLLNQKWLQQQQELRR